MRHDHTAWLIHFVRDRNPEQDFPGETEDEAGFYEGGELEPDADAFEVLKTIIRLGGITPGYSFRNGRTTIYGGQPAVCATEMPLYSFAEYVKKRGSTDKVSAYGIAFLKLELHAAGGRPAIYGLSTNKVTFEVDQPTRRIFSEDVLPRVEQYRYVAYNPSGVSKWVDWSHEREWRWIARDEEKDTIWALDYNGMFGSTPALPLFRGQEEWGGPFTRVCIIVWTKEEAHEIRELLTGIYLAGSNNYDTLFDRELLKRSHIIVLQDVVEAVEVDGTIEAQTIEGLDKAKLLYPVEIATAPPGTDKLVAAAMAKAAEAAKKAVAEFAAKHGLGGGYCGFAHAVTYDVTSPIVQYLLANEMASGPYDGEVWIDFPKDYPGSQSIDYNEAACDAAVEVLKKELGISVYTVTRPD